MKIKNTLDIVELGKMIKTGKTIALPFDTVYGIIADPFNDDAIDNIYKIKGRDFDKPVALIFSSAEMLKKYIDIDIDVENFIAEKVPGAYTFIFPWPESEKAKFAQRYQKLEKVGMRIPGCQPILDLVEELGHPIAATSANISGEPNCWSAEEFIEQIKDNEYKPDLIIDGGALEKNPPSEVIDISNLNQIKVLRN